MDSAEQQYQRDIARIEAHKLALKDDAFNNYLVELIRKVVNERFEYLKNQMSAPLTLHDQDFKSISVENADGLHVATFTFDYLRHEVTAHALRFVVLIERDKPVITAYSAGQPLGVVTEYQITKLTRNVVDSTAPDLPRPIK
jgi:hypothetical protein